MRLKPFLKNSARPVLLYNTLAILFISLIGCSPVTESTYKENEIPSVIKKICKDEYNLDVITKRLPNTLWVYASTSKMLHDEYGITKDKFFDEALIEKLRNILTAIGRVLLNCDKTPEFYGLVISDIKVGIDYTIIANILDTKKAYVGYIPEEEINKRFLLKLELKEDAIDDPDGKHFKFYDMSLAQFITGQISQRIKNVLSKEDSHSIFDAIFKDGVFKFEFDMDPVIFNKSYEEQITRFIAYTIIRSYEFKDFLSVEITDLRTEEKQEFGRSLLEKMKLDDGNFSSLSF